MLRLSIPDGRSSKAPHTPCQDRDGSTSGEANQHLCLHRQSRSEDACVSSRPMGSCSALLCSAPSYLHCWWSQYCEQCINLQIAASRQNANAQRGCRYQRSEFSITLFVKTASVNFELLNYSHNPSSFPFQAAPPLTHRFPSRFCSALTSGGCASICSHFAPPPPSTPVRRWKLWQVLGEWYRDYFSSC